MTRRREIERHIATFGDIAEIVEAMKNLALVEVRRVTGFIEAQRRSVAIVEDALADFFDGYPGFRAPPSTGGDVCCVVGSERGFCGDFNLRLAEAARTLGAQLRAPTRTVLVGANLSSAWTGAADARCAGASVADEVPATMARLAESIRDLMPAAPGGPPWGLVLLLHGEAGPELRRLLPLSIGAANRRPKPFPIDLDLDPADFLSAAMRQYLFAAPMAALYESLLAENQRRLDHMDRALRKMDDRLADLGRERNRQRQEEITEDIELILLSAGGTRTGRPAPSAGAQPPATNSIGIP
ncbi:MAG: F0F1 ATP synthase subunit gamma [Burkholderiaceae bacterium]|nr:F0F1 ATP synthase subunit gamma [Burkholderiaceae bacterium]